VVLEEGNHLVDGLNRGKALPLAFPDLLGVAAALLNCLSRWLASGASGRILGMQARSQTESTEQFKLLQLVFQTKAGRVYVLKSLTSSIVATV